MRHFSYLLLIMLACGHAGAATWYVSPTGNDGHPGSLSQPFKTIPVAISAAVPGDVIELRGGNYASAEIRINKSHLTLRSYPGEWAVISAPLNVEDIASCIWYDNPDVTGGTLERLEIKGGYYYGVSFETNWDWGLPAAQRRGASDITIHQCRIHSTGRDCVKIKPGCSNIHIISCELYASGIGPSNTAANGGPNAEGIDNVNGHGMVVRHCYIHHVSTTGVYVKGGAKDCIVESNFIAHTGEAGILLGFYTDAEFFDGDGSNPAYYECQYSLARNNIVFSTGGAGIGLFAARDCAVYHNTVLTASPQFHAPLFLSKGEIWINDNTTLTPANYNVQIFNNIIADQSGNGDEDYTVQLREGALTGTNVFERNIYHKASGPAKFEDGVNWPARSFSQWQSQFGFDASSMESNPMLDAQYHLQASSPAINAALASPATHDYDGQPRDAANDIGADEYGNGPTLAVPPPTGTLGTGAQGNVTAAQSLVPTAAFDLAPNPSRGWVQITGLPTDAQLRLYDANGRPVWTTEPNGGLINLSGLPAGIYRLEAYARGQHLGSKAVAKH